MQPAYLLASASSVESGSSILLVSGSRKLRTPLISVRLLKTTMGMDQWYMANMLSNGASKPPALLTMEPKPEAVCLKQRHRETLKYFLIVNKIPLNPSSTIITVQKWLYFKLWCLACYLYFFVPTNNWLTWWLIWKRLQWWNISFTTLRWKDSTYRKDVGNSSWTYTLHMDPAQFAKKRPEVANMVIATALPWME